MIYRILIILYRYKNRIENLDQYAALDTNGFEDVLTAYFCGKKAKFSNWVGEGEMQKKIWEPQTNRITTVST